VTPFQAWAFWTGVTVVLAAIAFWFTIRHSAIKPAADEPDEHSKHWGI
jgi:hypothetical protein